MVKIGSIDPLEHVSTQHSLKAVDFFCGAGGVTSGFKDAGITVLGGVDIDINCKETYIKNNNGTQFLHKDISKFAPEDLQTILKLSRNDDDLVFIGCSPCQYYSSVNNNKGKSEKGKLLLEDFQKFVDYFKPGYIFIENVPGLKKHKESPLGKFKQYLSENGYSYSDKVLNAKYFGVPQNRRRYVLLATRVSESIELPEENRESISTVRDTIGDTSIFPPIKAGHKDSSQFLHSAAKLKEINLQRIQNTTHNGGSRKDWEFNQKLQLNCYKDYDGHTDVYGRLYWDKPSPTITTKFYSLSNGRYGHPEQDRSLSLREGARLQSFRLDYQFLVEGQAKIARLIGNAVPPKMAKKIGIAIVQNKLHGAI